MHSMRMVRVLGAAACLSAFACQSSEMPFVGMDDQGRLEAVATGDLQQLSDNVRAEVSAAAGLSYKSPVEAVYKARGSLRYELEQEHRREQGLSATEPLSGAAKNEIEVMSQVLLGYYDPANRHRLVVVDDVEPIDRVTVMRHELVHALQDQYWPLRERQKTAEALGPEASLALRAVIEGQAKAIDGGLRTTRALLPWNPRPDGASIFGGSTARAQVDFRDASAHPHDPVYEMLAYKTGVVEPTLVELAPVLRSVVPDLEAGVRMFPYVAGKAFIRALQKTAPLAQVIAMTLERPPTATRQILHPQDYLDNVQPEAMQLDAIEAWFAAWTPEPGSSAQAAVPARPFSLGEYMTVVSLGGARSDYQVAEKLRNDRMMVGMGPTSYRAAWVALWADEPGASAFSNRLAAQLAAGRAESVAAAADQGISAEEAQSYLPAEEVLIQCGRATVLVINDGSVDLAALRTAARADLAGYGTCR